VLQQGGGCAGLIGLLLLPKQQKFKIFKKVRALAHRFFLTTSLQSMCTCSPADICPSCCCCTPDAWACWRLTARAASDALSAAAASASRSALSPKRKKKKNLRRHDPAARTIENRSRADFDNLCLSPGVVSSGPATEILKSQCPKTFTI